MVKEGKELGDPNWARKEGEVKVLCINLK